MSDAREEWVQERVNAWFAERPQRPIRELILACLDEVAPSVSVEDATSADTKRLDWLEKNAHGVYAATFFPDGRLMHGALVRSRIDSLSAKTLRGAIDMAMSDAPSSTERSPE